MGDERKSFTKAELFGQDFADFSDAKKLTERKIAMTEAKDELPTTPPTDEDWIEAAARASSLASFLRGHGVYCTAHDGRHEEAAAVLEHLAAIPRPSPAGGDGSGVNCPDCGGRIAAACPHCGAEPVADDALASLTPPDDRIRVAIEALEPFAELGLPFTKAGEKDDSVWAAIPDDTVLVIGREDMRWNRLTVGDLRRADAALTRLQGEPT